VLRLVDKRTRETQPLSWLFLRQAEQLLFNTKATNGAFMSMLQRSASTRTTMPLTASGVPLLIDGDEFKGVLRLFNKYARDPLLCKARCCTVVPLAVFLQCVARAGYCDKHVKILRAFCEPEPPSWVRERQMEKERAEGAFRIHPLPQLGDELLEECLSISDELRMVSAADHAPTPSHSHTPRQDYVEIEENEGLSARHDDGTKRRYSLASISKKLQRQLDDMRRWKRELFK